MGGKTRGKIFSLVKRCNRTTTKKKDVIETSPGKLHWQVVLCSPLHLLKPNLRLVWPLFLRNALKNDSSVFFSLWVVVVVSFCFGYSNLHAELSSPISLSCLPVSPHDRIWKVIFPPHQQISGDNLLILYVKYYFYIYWEIVDWQHLSAF